MKPKNILFLFSILFFVFTAGHDVTAGEMYIITTRDGSQIIVKDYHFTDDRVEFTTGNDLPGFIRKDDFVGIANMVGTLPKEEENKETVEEVKKRELQVWLLTVSFLIIVYLLYLFFVIRKKKSKKTDGEIPLPAGSVARNVKTQGHLSFQYKEITGRKTDWTIEVRDAYEQDGILFVEGICTTTDKRKTFRSDRVIGPVQDMSTSRRGHLEAFFAEAEDEA